MTDPIDNSSGRVGRPDVSGASNQRRSEQTGEASARRPDPGVGEDASLQSERLRNLRQTIDNTPDVDSSRVSEIRDRIARGDYPLDPERIASRFVEFERLINE